MDNASNQSRSSSAISINSSADPSPYREPLRDEDWNQIDRWIADTLENQGSGSPTAPENERSESPIAPTLKPVRRRLFSCDFDSETENQETSAVVSDEGGDDNVPITTQDCASTAVEDVEVSDELQEHEVVNVRSKDYDTLPVVAAQPGTSNSLRRSSSGEFALPIPPRTYYKEYAVAQVDPVAESHKKNKHFCLYCRKLLCKLPNHLESAHSEEEAVIRLKMYPKGHKKRKLILEKIRKEGKFIYNTNRLYSRGNLKVARRPTAKSSKVYDSTHYLPCPVCKDYFARRSLYKHYQRCKDIDNGTHYRRNLTRRSRGVDCQLHEVASQVLRARIFIYLNDDRITRIIRFDVAAITYGNFLCSKYAASDHHDPMIRAKLRGIGRLLLEAKEINSAVTDFASLLVPPFYDTVIAAIKRVAGLLENENKYRAPATASGLVTLVRSVADIWQSECIKLEDAQGVARVANFLSLFKTNSAVAINKVVIENQVRLQRQKIVSLPSTKDVDTFCQYIRRKRNHYLAEMCKPNMVVDYDTWLNLASFSLISVLIFNRRRPGEIERATLEDYRSAENFDDNSVAERNLLSDNDKGVLRSYSRFLIRGKLNRTVPVLLSMSMKTAIEAVIKYRSHFGVNESNPYIFGLPGSSDRNHYLRAHILMRKYSAECGVDNHIVLRATILRKQLATHALNLDLQDMDVQHLADFMGHAKDIHKNIYRQRTFTRDVCVVSNILKSAQGAITDSEDSDNDEPSSHDDATSGPSASTSEIQTGGPISALEMAQWQPFVRMFPVPPAILAQGTSAERSLTIYPSPDRDVPSPSPDRDVYSPSADRDVYSPSPARDVPTISSGKKKIRNRTTSRRWSSKEKAAIARIFARHFASGEMPSYAECEAVSKNEPDLQTRSMMSIRLYMHNTMRAQKSPKKLRFTECADGRTKVQRQSWTSPQRQILLKEFHKNLRSGELPSLQECRALKRRYPELKHRTTPSIKTAINNELNRRARYRFR